MVHDVVNRSSVSVGHVDNSGQSAVVHNAVIGFYVVD